MQIDFGPLTLTCINSAAIVIWPKERNANAAKAQCNALITGNAALGQVYYRSLKCAHIESAFYFLVSVYSCAKPTVNKQQQQQSKQHKTKKVNNQASSAAATRARRSRAR